MRRPRCAFTASVLGILMAVTAAIAQNDPAPETRIASGPVLQQRHPRYVLERGDVLLLNFPLTPEMNQTVTIQPDGYVNLQGASSVYARGLTAPALSEAVKKAYAGVLHDPILSIDVEDFQKPFFSVLGQVGKPGQYELRADISVAEGLAEAGGLTMSTAKTQVFLFRRTSTDWFEVRKINLKEILHGKEMKEDPMLEAGDMIYVPEKFIANFRKYVPYGFNAGTYLQQPAF